MKVEKLTTLVTKKLIPCLNFSKATHTADGFRIQSLHRLGDGKWKVVVYLKDSNWTVSHVTVNDIGEVIDEVGIVLEDQYARLCVEQEEEKKNIQITLEMEEARALMYIIGQYCSTDVEEFYPILENKICDNTSLYWKIREAGVECNFVNFSESFKLVSRNSNEEIDAIMLKKRIVK